MLGCGDTSICSCLVLYLRGAICVYAHSRIRALVRLLSSSCSYNYRYIYALIPSSTQLTYPHRLSLLLANTLHLLAFNYYFIITFLGYNALSFLHHTELLLVPIAITTLLWFASLFGFNMSRHFAPVLWAGAGLRKGV